MVAEPTFLFDAFQAFFLITPILSMFWRGVAFKAFNVIRGFIRITLYVMINTLGLGGVAAVPPSSPKKPASKTKAGKKEDMPNDAKEKEAVAASGPNPFVKRILATLTAIDTVCIHARGWMQALPSLVKLSPLNVGPTNTFIYWCEVEYHLIFFVVYYITMHVSKTTQMKNARIVVWTMRFFGWSDLTKNAAWMWYFATHLIKDLSRVLPMAYAFMMAAPSEVLSAALGNADSVWKSTAQYEDAVATISYLPLPQQLASVVMKALTAPEYFLVWFSTELTETEQLTLVKMALGVFICALDMYSYLAAMKAHPVVLAVIQILSASFYVWISFY